MRVLLISPVAPYPPTTGGRQRTNVIASGLRRIADLDLFLTGDIDELDPQAQAALHRDWGLVGAWRSRKRGQYWPWSCVRGLSPRIVDRAAAFLGRRSVDFRPQPDAVAMIEALLQSRSYDAVVCRYLSSGVHTGILLMDVRKIVDIDDLDTQAFEDRLALPGIAWWQRLLFRMQLWQLRRLVTAWTREASHLWLSCAQDLPSVMGQSTSLLPNIPFQAAASEPEFPLVKPTVPVVLIVGTLNHPPNVRGIDYFIEQVWPGVLERFPETQLRIVGGKLRDAERRRWMKARNVCVVGFVDSLAGEYRAATIVAVPILEGGGTKIKVLEALQYGCATVVTRHSLRGYANHLHPGESLVLATNADEFVAAVSTLLRDKDLRERLGQSGRAAVAKDYSRELVYAEIERVLRGGA